MTRKHYIALAAALASTRPHIDEEPFTRHSAIGDNTMVNHVSFDAALDAWTATRDAIVGALGDNTAFDPARFIEATCA